MNLFRLWQFLIIKITSLNLKVTDMAMWKHTLSVCSNCGASIQKCNSAMKRNELSNHR